MNRGSTFAAFFLALVMAAAFVYWRLQQPKDTRQAGHVIAVDDISASMPRNCAALTASVRDALNGLHVRKGSTFSLITTGGRSTRYEPKLARTIAIPPAAGNVYGNGRDEFFADVTNACEGLEPAEASAIFRAVTIGLEQARGLGCTNPADCRLILISDLEENADRAVMKRLLRGKPEPGAPPLLDNANVATTICGYVETTGGGGPRNYAQALVEGWRGLFTVPPSFRPYCEATPQGAAQSARR